MNNPEDNIESPCVRNCCLDQNDICMGCYRSMAEVMAWTSMTKEEQKVVLVNAKQRAKEADTKNSA